MSGTILKTSVPDMAYVYADKARAELHVLGAVSGDQKFVDKLESSDYHRSVIADARHISPEQVTDADREASKTISYSFAYTAFTPEVAAATAVSKLGIDKDEAMNLALSILQQYPDLVQWAEDEIYEWFDNEGWYTYLCNLRKHEPIPLHIPREINKLRPTQSARIVVNQVAQNSIGVLLKLVLSAMSRDEVLAPNAHNVIQTFDAIGFNTPTESLPQVVRRLYEKMTTVLTVECERTGRITTTIIRADISTSTRGFKFCKKVPKTVLPQLDYENVRNIVNERFLPSVQAQDMTSAYVPMTDQGVPAQWCYWKRTARANPYATGPRPIDLVDNKDNPWANPLTADGDDPIFGF